MFLNRISDHLQAQNWFSVVLDMVIVFLAVFVGLQADNWNQERIAKSNAHVYYARLADDLRAEEITRLARITYYQQTLDHGRAALSALGGHQPELDEAFLVDLYQATQIWNYSPQRATYDELLSIGIANAIPDVMVRKRLANYYTGLANSKQIQQERTPYRQMLRRYMPHVVQADVREHCGDVFHSRPDGVVLITLPDVCSLGLNAQVVDAAVAKTLMYPDLEIDLTQAVADLENKVMNLNNYIAPTRETISMLEKLAK